MKVGIIGWRGMVGSVLIKRMVDEGDFDYIEPFFFSSSKNVDLTPLIHNKKYNVHDSDNLNLLKSLDVILTTQGSDFTKKTLNKLRNLGWRGFWIDAASFKRLHEDALIVLDPINGKSIKESIKKGVKNYIGGNCTVSLMLLALQGLFENDIVEWLSAMTYQSSSGAGATKMRDLISEMGSIYSSVEKKIDDSKVEVLELESDISKNYIKDSFPTQNIQDVLAGNILPWIDKDLNNGISKEELKYSIEANKILGLGKNQIPIDGICVRVPVLRCHCQAITIKTTKKIDEKELANIIKDGNSWVNVIENNKTSTLKNLTPLKVNNSLDINVGRIKKLSIGENFFSIFTVGDQLLWGAAEPLRRVLRMLIS